MLFNSIVGKVIQVPHIFGLKYAGSEVKNLPAMQETRIQSLGWEDPVEKGIATHSLFLLGEFHGQRRLVSYCS